MRNIWQAGNKNFPKDNKLKKKKTHVKRNSSLLSKSLQRFKAESRSLYLCIYLCIGVMLFQAIIGAMGEMETIGTDLT